MFVDTVASIDCTELFLLLPHHDHNRANFQVLISNYFYDIKF